MRLFAASLNKNKISEPTDIYGCTDPNALNYNPNATIDDGSCIYDTSGFFTFPANFPMTFE